MGYQWVEIAFDNCDSPSEVPLLFGGNASKGRQSSTSSTEAPGWVPAYAGPLQTTSQSRPHTLGVKSVSWGRDEWSSGDNLGPGPPDASRPRPARKCISGRQHPGAGGPESVDVYAGRAEFVASPDDDVRVFREAPRYPRAWNSPFSFVFGVAFVVSPMLGSFYSPFRFARPPTRSLSPLSCLPFLMGRFRYFKKIGGHVNPLLRGKLRCQEGYFIGGCPTLFKVSG